MAEPARVASISPEIQWDGSAPDLLGRPLCVTFLLSRPLDVMEHRVLEGMYGDPIGESDGARLGHMDDRSAVKIVDVAIGGLRANVTELDALLREVHGTARRLEAQNAALKQQAVEAIERINRELH